jgi:GT2 family glycosyltransferase
MKPLVSFVIPFYQQKDYIGEAVRSALDQTMPDLEVVVVDDGSTDGGSDVVEAMNDKRVRLYKRDNGGPSAALNDALRLAQGKYVAFLGGDDVANPDRVSAQIEHLENGDADIIFSLPSIIDASGDEINDVLLTNNVFRPVHDGTPAAIFRRLIVSGNFFCAPSAFMRRDIIERVGWFRNELIQLQDYDYWLRAAAAGYHFSVMSNKKTRYRRHSSNLSNSSGDQAVSGEIVECLYRNLLEAPADIIAAAFPEFIPLGAATASPLDRAVIALSHPLAKEMAASLLIKHFMASVDPIVKSDNLSFDSVGLLITQSMKSNRAWLRSEVQRVSEITDPYDSPEFSLRSGK